MRYEQICGNYSPLSCIRRSCVSQICLKQAAASPLEAAATVSRLGFRHCRRKTQQLARGSIVR